MGTATSSSTRVGTTSIHPDDAARVRAEFISDLRGDMVQSSWEYRIVRPDGSIRYVISEREYERDEDGRAVALTGTILDITERKELEQLLLVSQKSEALGTLVAGVSHEFNNLLQVILANLHFASRPSADAGDLQRRLRDASTAAEAAGALVQQLRQFARRDPPNRQPLDIAMLVRDTVDLLRSTSDRRIKLSVETPSPPPSIVGDSGQLQQVVMNLLLNARHAVLERYAFLERSTQQSVGDGYEPYLSVRVERERDGDDPELPVGVLLIVEDNGIGMTEHTRERALDPFFTTKPSGQGTGLGLATVQGIVAEHGGSISLRSEPGQGTM